MAAKKVYSFSSVLYNLDGNIWHYHLKVPVEIHEKFKNEDDLRIIVRVNDLVEWQAAIMPNGEDYFFININKENRKKLRLEIGDKAAVQIWKDDSKYGLPIPEEFDELLKMDPEGDEAFHNLTPGKQRALLFIVGKPKSSQLRIEKSVVVVEHLKRNKGKIDFKQLNIDFRKAKN